MERPNNTTIALLAGIAVLIVIVAIYAASRNSDQDRLGDYASVENAAASDTSRACASQHIYDAIKTELFSRAAAIRGEDREAYAQIAQSAFARMENATAEGEPESSGIVNCTGSLSLILPPGLEASGGRRQLMADVDFSVDINKNRAVSLRNADALVNSLASLARIDAEPNQPLLPPATTTAEDGLAAEGQEISGETVVAPPARPRVQPSFDCSRAGTRSERTVCGDPALADLDRAMTAEYQRAVSAADTRQAALLRQTRDRFLEYRENCANSACIADAYTGRIREIGDIMTGRWRQPR